VQLVRIHRAAYTFKHEHVKIKGAPDCLSTRNWQHDQNWQPQQ